MIIMIAARVIISLSAVTRGHGWDELDTVPFSILFVHVFLLDSLNFTVAEKVRIFPVKLEVVSVKVASVELAEYLTEKVVVGTLIETEVPAVLQI